MLFDTLQHAARLSLDGGELAARRGANIDGLRGVLNGRHREPTSSSLVQQTIDAGKKTGEKFWELPMFDEYKDLIKSDVADMKNSGGRQAGSISAALLLAEFVDGAAWVHLDIAGTSTSDRDSGYLVKGATGVPVRTLAQLATDLAEAGAPKKSKSKAKAK